MIIETRFMINQHHRILAKYDIFKKKIVTPEYIENFQIFEKYLYL